MSDDELHNILFILDHHIGVDISSIRKFLCAFKLDSTRKTELIIRCIASGINIVANNIEKLFTGLKNEHLIKIEESLNKYCTPLKKFMIEIGMPSKRKRGSSGPAKKKAKHF
jgi:hypothetical protein